MVREAAVKALQCYGGPFAVQSMIAKKQTVAAQTTGEDVKALPGTEPQKKKSLKAGDLVGTWRVEVKNLRMPNLNAVLFADGDWLLFHRVGNISTADNSTLVRLKLKGYEFEENSFRDSGTWFGQGSTKDCAGRGSSEPYDVRVKGRVSEDGRRITFSPGAAFIKPDAAQVMHGGR